MCYHSRLTVVAGSVPCSATKTPKTNRSRLVFFRPFSPVLARIHSHSSTEWLQTLVKIQRTWVVSIKRTSNVGEVGWAVSTVRAHLAKPGLPSYEHKAKRSSQLVPFETYQRERQAAVTHPTEATSVQPRAGSIL